MFEATISFTGLCAFVPSTDNKRMRVVLVNARPGGVIEEEFANGHTPVIEFDIASLDKNEGNIPRPAFEVYDNKRGFWFMNHDNIKLVTEGVGDLSFKDTEITMREPANDEEAKWLFWAPHMKKASKGGGKMKSEWLKEDTPGARKRVIARLDIANGLLLPDRFTKTASRYIPWFFRKKGGSANDHAQTLAESLILDLGVAVTKLRFDITAFNGTGTNLRRLTFKPDANGTVRIWVRNLELEQVIAPFEAGFPEIVEDFQYFHDLVEGGNRNVPHRKETRARSLVVDEARAVTRPICPSAIFSQSDV